MGRWLASLRDKEKNTKTPGDGTPKTPKTASREVLGVLGVPSGAVSKIFFRHDESAGEGFGGFGGDASGTFTKNFPTVTPASDPLSVSPEDRRAAVARLLDAMQAENEARRDWWREPVPKGRLTLRSVVTGETRVIAFPKRGRS